MKKEMLINVLQPEECRIAILEDGVLEELYVERTSHENYTGNIYKGKIVNIESAIQAGFVDFSVGRNGFLHVSDVEPQYYRRGGDDDLDVGPRDKHRVAREGEERARPPRPTSSTSERDRPADRDRDKDRDRRRERPDRSERGRRDRSSDARRFGEGLSDDEVPQRASQTPPPPPSLWDEPTPVQPPPVSPPMRAAVPPPTAPEWYADLPPTPQVAPPISPRESPRTRWNPASEEVRPGPESQQRGRLPMPIDPIEAELPPSRTQRHRMAPRTASPESEYLTRSAASPVIPEEGSRPPAGTTAPRGTPFEPGAGLGREARPGPKHREREREREPRRGRGKPRGGMNEPPSAPMSEKAVPLPSDTEYDTPLGPELLPEVVSYDYPTAAEPLVPTLPSPVGEGSQPRGRDAIRSRGEERGGRDRDRPRGRDRDRQRGRERGPETERELAQGPGPGLESPPYIVPPKPTPALEGPPPSRPRAREIEPQTARGAEAEEFPGRAWKPTPTPPPAPGRAGVQGYVPRKERERFQGGFQELEPPTPSTLPEPEEEEFSWEETDTHRLLEKDSEFLEPGLGEDVIDPADPNRRRRRRRRKRERPEGGREPVIEPGFAEPVAEFKPRRPIPSRPRVERPAPGFAAPTPSFEREIEPDRGHEHEHEHDEFEFDDLDGSGLDQLIDDTDSDLDVEDEVDVDLEVGLVEEAIEPELEEEIRREIEEIHALEREMGWRGPVTPEPPGRGRKDREFGAGGAVVETPAPGARALRARGVYKPPIQEIFRRGDEVLVQVIKESIGTKGPTLSTYISIPGRYLVLMPGLNRVGVSRKIADDSQRRRLRQIMLELNPPKGLGFIVRTAGLERTKRELARDLAYLLRLWKTILRRIRRTRAPAPIYQESDMITRTIRDIFTDEIDTIWIDEPTAFEHAQEFLKNVMPRYVNRLKFYDEKTPLFHKYGIEDEIAKIHRKHIPLVGGGSIVIEPTEALVAIDVNSGNFRVEGDAERTAYEMNLRAAKEISRQLRLRDLGGVIINDFIDMREEKNRRGVERALRDAIKRDRARTKVLRMSAFGIIEMTRQRIRPSLKRSVYEDCSHCSGAGVIKTVESMAIDAMRLLALAAHRDDVRRINLCVHPAVALYLNNRKRKEIAKLEVDANLTIHIRHEADTSPEHMQFDCYDANNGEIRVFTPPQPPPSRRGGGGGGASSSGESHRPFS